MIRPKLIAVSRRFLALRAAVRWKYVLPRVVIVAALVLAVRYGLDPLLKYALVAGGEAALGAKVEVAELSTSLLDGQIEIAGFAAANPKKPLRNLAEAEHVRLRVDLAALTRKRLVVTSGVIRGIKFDSERTASGALEQAPIDDEAGPSAFDPVIASASDAAADWLASLQGRLEDDLEARLATPRVVRELEDRWKQQYAALQARADQLRAKSKQLERDFRDAKKNPLRGAQQLNVIQQQLAAVHAEFKTTLAELQALPAQARADRAAVDAARKQDQEFLKTAVQTAKTDGGQLSEYLLGDVAHGYLAQTASWIHTVRSWLPRTKIKRPDRARGTNIVFVDRRRPKCLIQSVALTGTARFDGQPLDVTGLLTDAASEPELHERPLQLHLVAGGAAAGDLLVTIDRRRGAVRDTAVLDCPHLLVGQRTLGRADKLAVRVAEGAASVFAEIKLEGDALSGSIDVRQSATLSAALPAVRDDRIAAMVGESLAGVDRLEAHIDLAGTLRRPRCNITSNVGPQLAEGMSGAVRRYLAERRDRLVAKVQGQVDEQLARLDARRAEAQQELLGKLGEDQQLVAQLSSLLGGTGSLEGLAVPKLGSAVNLERFKR